MYIFLLRYGNYFKDPKIVTFEILQDLIATFFTQEPFYRSQLSKKHSAVLQVCYAKSGKEGLNDREADIYQQTDIGAEKIILDSLVRYCYLQRLEPLQFPGDVYLWKNKEWKKANPSKPKPSKIILADAPLQFSRLCSIEEFWMEQGFYLEAISRSVFEHSSTIRQKCALSDKAKIHYGYWSDNDTCTEIDILISDELSQTIIWGSCKRESHKLNYVNLLAHVVSFFNTRGYGLHPWFFYTHKFLFVASKISTDQRQTLKESITHINILLGDKQLLQKSTINHLPSLQLSQDQIPADFFTVKEVFVLDLSDFADVVQELIKKNHIPE